MGSHLPKTFILSIRDSVDGVWALSTHDAYNLAGQNLGNLAFHYAMVRILEHGQEFFPWHASVERLNQTGQIGVIPCANQLGPHADFGGLAKRFSGLKIPLVAVGLGAQGDWRYGSPPPIPEGTQNWVKEIAARSPEGVPNIGVRGEFTLKVLEHHGLAEKAIVTGCPTLFINSDSSLGKKILEKSQRPWERVAVAAGHPGWSHLSRIERSLTKIMEDSGGSYIVQSPIQMVSLARGESDQLSEADLKASRDLSNPDLDLAEFRRWSRKHYRAFFNVSEWMECLRGYDLVVGARIHGVMLGIQAGIPGICIAHDSRTRELCETMLVPFIMAKDIMAGVTLEELRTKFVFDAEQFDENRRTLGKRLNNFLKLNDIPESPLIKQITS